VTRREYVLIGSTATSMSPTVTGATMPIFTTPLAVRSAKSYCPKVCFKVKNSSRVNKAVAIEKLMWWGYFKPRSHARPIF